VVFPEVRLQVLELIIWQKGCPRRMRCAYPAYIDRYHENYQ